MSIYDNGKKDKWFEFGFTSRALQVFNSETNTVVQEVDFETFKNLKEASIRSGIKRVEFNNGWWLTTMMMQNIEKVIQSVEALNNR